MNALEKKRMISVFKYTWPFYVISAILIGLAFSYTFRLTHRLPAYKKLTLFISGEIVDSKNLKKDMLEKYKDKGLESVSYYSAKPTDNEYFTKLSVPGYNSSDVLIIPLTQLDVLNASAFALELSNELINEYYPNNILYEQDSVSYGIKVNKDKINNYINLPDEDCYLLLNGKSENLGEYSKNPNKDHDLALCLVQDWGV